MFPFTPRTGARYPYTDLHDMNLDWILEQVLAIGNKVAELENVSNAYTDEQIKALRTELLAELDKLHAQLNKEFAALSSEFDAVQAALKKDLEDMQYQLDAGLSSIAPRINQAIKEYDTYIKAYINNQLIDVQVINYFTGEKVSIQVMFDTLARFHVTNGLTYQQIADRGYTYQEMIDICKRENRTYGDIVMNAATIFPQK